MNNSGSPPNWAEPKRFAWLLAVMILIPFWNVVLGFDTFVARDWGLFSFPVAMFHKESFWRGELPLWNPYSCCGTPFLAQFNTLALYPLSLIYLLLPLTWSLPMFCLCHVFLAGMGMYGLARRWTESPAAASVAGVAFAFNGLSLNMLMWPSHIATYAWIPWVILLMEDGCLYGGRKMIAAAFAAGMQILAGGPETIAFTWLVAWMLAATLCARRPREALATARRQAVISFLALGLAAAQLLPSLDLAMHSQRENHLASSEWSMPLSGWGNFLVPLFQTTLTRLVAPDEGQYWTSSYYAGIATVFLCGIALWRGKRMGRVWFLGILLLTSLVLALGYHGMLFAWMQKLAPVLKLFRYPVKFVILTMTVAPLLAAFGVAQIEKKSDVGSQGWRLEIAWGLALGALLSVVLWVGWRWPVEHRSWSVMAGNGLIRCLFLVLAILALFLFASRSHWGFWRIVPLLAVCWLDVLTHRPWQNPTVDPSVFQPGLGAMHAKFAPVPDIAQSRLMMSPFAARQFYYLSDSDLKTEFLLDRIVFLANCNLLDGLPKVDGFFSLNLRESDKVLWLLDSRNGAKLDKLEDLLSVSQTIAPGKVLDWMPRANYIPIVSVGQAPKFAEDQTTLEAIANDRADFRNVAYLPTEARSAVKAGREPNARILTKNFTPLLQTIEVETPSATLLVLSQAYYHNWRTRLDGAPATLWRANYAFEAVEVPAGRHRIALSYQDTALGWGAAISLAALAACTTGWLFLRRKNANMELETFAST